jgi:hypothetical protein
LDNGKLTERFAGKFAKAFLDFSGPAIQSIFARSFPDYAINIFSLTIVK